MTKCPRWPHHRRDFGKDEFRKASRLPPVGEVSGRIWEVVLGWDYFARDTIGKQVVRAVDSIGANIVEGIGRGRYPDNRRFARIARGSLNETKHWLRRAYKRSLLTRMQIDQLKPMMDELGPMLNAYLKSIGNESLRK